MTDTPTENLENTEVTPFTEGDREIAYRTDSNPVSYTHLTLPTIYSV